jgi:hypothetical protein
MEKCKEVELYKDCSLRAKHELATMHDSWCKQNPLTKTPCVYVAKF